MEKKRGRKSAAAVAVIDQLKSPLETIERPPVPYELDDEEATVWCGVVDRMPATWFGSETFPLLVQYCRHVVRARRVAQLIRHHEQPPKPKKGEQAAELDIDAYNKLLIMQDRESRAIATLATKMRIAQQSTIDKEAKKNHVGLKRPWEAE